MLFSFILIGKQAFTQNDSIGGISNIQTLLERNSIEKAELEINEQTANLIAQKRYNSLARYVYIVGKIQLLKNKDVNANTVSEHLASLIQNNTKDANTLYQTNINLSKLYFELNNIQKAYDYALIARNHASKLKANEHLLISEYYLGDYGMKLGKIALLEQHIRQAVQIIKKSPKLQYKITARVYNLMGATMYYSSKQDSAIYYFEAALDHVKFLEKNYENQLYLPAAIKGNLFLMYLNQGKHEQAKTLVEESITLSKTFLKKATNHPLAPRVKRNIGIGYTNLSSLYNDLGDFTKSEQISELSYKHAEQHFDHNSQEYFMAALNLAEIKNTIKAYDEALKYLNKADVCLRDMVDENDQLHAFLYNAYATNFYQTKQYNKAITYWSLSDEYYIKSNSGEYDTNRLYSKMNLALTYAEINDKEKAYTTLKEPYHYFLKKNGENDYLTNELLVTLARVALKLKDYEESLKWTEYSLNIYNSNTKEEGYNKIQIEDKKAEILLINAKSKYYLAPTRDSLFLKELLKTTTAALTSIEQKKSIFVSIDNINAHLENNKEIISFSKRIYLELYYLTKNKNYLNKLISLHESIIYNRIRLHLNLRKNINFLNIPEEKIKREEKLRNKLAQSLDNDIDDFFKARKQWTIFLDTLKQHYPQYYKMRYAILEKPLDKLQDNISNQTTVVRYLFIEDDLYAFVVTKSDRNIYKLDSNNLKDLIYSIEHHQFNISEISTIYNALFNKLWNPFAEKINSKNVIIIPDGELFNLSFETLISNPIASFRELAATSLLAKYNISYNYSLLLLHNSKKTKFYEADFIAFAPEFNSKMKLDYRYTITDSLILDKTYLTLLPQPFAMDLAKKSSKRFNGRSFLNEKASKQIFTKQAKEHKIIHIGTHAESNNISPELSRLIFAKNVNDTISSEDNSLYTYEIYNQNLSSNLTILTACETGKPTHQAGEGMISLAHAFNYAGSESILTSLWKIDEQSSSIIIERFYSHLDNGLAKDEALQQAKLDYIASAEGRTIAPQYWAGLVLIGDTTPIDFNTTSNLIFWLLGIALIIITTIVIFSKRAKRRKYQKTKKSFQLERL